MIDFKKPVQTRDGRAVTIFTTEANGSMPVVGQIAGTSAVHRWYPSGGYSAPGNPLSYADLVNVPERHVVYLNIYPGHDPVSYPTREQADAGSGGDPGRKACVRLEYTEGQFDE